MTDFLKVPRAVVCDSGLRPQDVGMLAYLLSMPGDWEPSCRNLEVDFGLGRDVVRGSIRRLEEAGYLVRSRVFTEENVWVSEWEITLQTALTGSVNDRRDGKPDMPATAGKTGNPTCLQIEEGRKTRHGSENAAVAAMTENPTSDLMTENPSQVLISYRDIYTMS